MPEMPPRRGLGAWILAAPRAPMASNLVTKAKVRLPGASPRDGSRRGNGQTWVE